MNTNLLYVPLRQSRPIDMGSELREVIRKDYFQTPSSFEPDLMRISNARNKITLLTNETISQKSEILLKEYYVYLLAVMKKFLDGCVEFGWYGTLTYGPSGPTKSRSLKVELWNIVFQLGSFYSQMALQESRFTDDGLKNACALFQQAAGCFEYICQLVKRETDQSSNSLAIPRDFYGDTVLCLKFLMLAQAQETIWQKALGNTTLKDTVIARLSMLTSDLYGQALEYGNRSDYIKLEWINHIGVKKFHFKAAAYYRMSIVSQDSFEYGEQVALLRVASSSCDSALKYKKYVTQLVVEDLRGLNQTIKDVLRGAEKDNDLVYIKPVPVEKDLKPIAAVSMVKATVPSDLETPVETRKLLFNDLLPYIVIQVAQAFRERQDKYIYERFVEPIQALNNMLVKFITERGLPASIDALQQSENLPDSIIQHSQEILAFGGTDIIEDSITEINKLSMECQQLIDHCNGRLTLDAKEEDMMRQRHGREHWNHQTTEVAARALIERIEKMIQYLDQARDGDSCVLTKYYEIKPYLEIYCGGYKPLSEFIPNSDYSKVDKNMSNIITDLRNAVNQVSVLEEQRKRFLLQVELKAREHNILPSVIEEFKLKQNEMYDENGNVNERSFEVVYDKHIKLFSKEMKFMESTKSTQISLENDIDTLNSRFISDYNTRSSDSQVKRKEALQLLEAVYSKYLEVISNLSEGSKFYNDFLVKGNGVLSECEDYLNQRRLESRELELTISKLFRSGPSQHSHGYDEELSPTSVHESREMERLRKEVEEETRATSVGAPITKPGIWSPDQGIKFD